MSVSGEGTTPFYMPRPYLPNFCPFFAVLRLQRGSTIMPWHVRPAGHDVEGALSTDNGPQQRARSLSRKHAYIGRAIKETLFIAQRDRRHMRELSTATMPRLIFQRNVERSMSLSMHSSMTKYTPTKHTTSRVSFNKAPSFSSLETNSSRAAPHRQHHSSKETTSPLCTPEYKSYTLPLTKYLSISLF